MLETHLALRYTHKMSKTFENNTFVKSCACNFICDFEKSPMIFDLRAW